MQKQFDSLVEKISLLLIRSEERIDKTNEMIQKCVNVIGKLTDEYTKQLEKLQAVRDEVVNQNNTLLSMLQKSEEKYERLLDKTISLAKDKKSENNINLK